jgi:hypothetical protein
MRRNHMIAVLNLIMIKKLINIQKKSICMTNIDWMKIHTRSWNKNWKLSPPNCHGIPNQCHDSNTTKFRC